MRVLCFTWNVGNAEPVEGELEHWLPSEGGDYDIIACGTQENAYRERRPAEGSLPLANDDDDDDDDDEDHEQHDESEPPLKVATQSPDRRISRDEPSKREESTQWEAMLGRRLGSHWTLCKLIVLRQMRLAVFVRGKHLSADTTTPPTVRNVQSARSATGIGGVVGNKGGLVVALTFGHTSICFVSCHLAAHAHKLAQRNANCREILRETRRLIGTPELDVLSEYDHVFWLGDLNYRLDPAMAAAAAATAAASTFAPAATAPYSNIYSPCLAPATSSTEASASLAPSVDASERHLRWDEGAGIVLEQLATPMDCPPSASSVAAGAPETGSEASGSFSLAPSTVAEGTHEEQHAHIMQVQYLCSCHAYDSA